MSHSEFDLDDRVDRQLAKVAPVPPPPDLAAAIMTRVAETERELSAWRRWRRAAHVKRVTNFGARTGLEASQSRTERPGAAPWRSTVAKKVVWGFATVGVAAVAAFVFFGFPPVGPGHEGSIGAAKRDQTSQVAPGDVKVPDAQVQQFVQSDTFDKLLKDPAARAFLTNLANNPALSTAFGNPSLASSTN